MSEKKTSDFLSASLSAMAMGSLAYFAGFLGGGGYWRDPKREERKAIVAALERMSVERDHWGRLMRGYASVVLSDRFKGNARIVEDYEASIASIDFAIRESDIDKATMEARLKVLDAEIKAEEEASKKAREDALSDEKRALDAEIERLEKLRDGDDGKEEDCND
jgi:hypothetical protein